MNNNNMEAIVLTFDKYCAFSSHMIKCYMDLWPDNPFVFRVPYQSEETRYYFENLFNDKVMMVKSPSGIVDTMETILSDFKDDDWIFWCMDDRYPMALNLDEIKLIYDFIQSPKSNGISALMYVNAPWCWLDKELYKHDFKINNGEQTYLRRKGYRMIWIHQFMRVKVLRTLFSYFPADMKTAKNMDYIMYQHTLPDNQWLYMLDHNAAVYGESTSRGLITRNCLKSFKDRGIDLPEGFDFSDKTIIQGTNTPFDNRLYALKYGIKKMLGIKSEV